MPYLMVDLDNSADCRRGIKHIRQVLGRAGGELVEPQPKGQQPLGSPACDGLGGGGGPGKAPLRQKLQRIQQRGVWRFLSGIANLNDQPRSLAEFDEALGLKPNKMRSTKAIFAKIENRLDVRFLVPDDDAGQDEAGNPRYRMPPRMRKVIRNLSA